jgi:uncharacterized membrane protein YciS (DUF1049 family)
MDMLYGALGAFFVIALLGLGFCLGWVVRGKIYRGKAEQPSERDLKKMEAQQKAFLQMQGYNADVVYGTTPLKEGEIE